MLVRVYTQDGVAGIGEAYWKGGDALVDRMNSFLVGETPFGIDRIYEHLVQNKSGESSISESRGEVTVAAPNRVRSGRIASEYDRGLELIVRVTRRVLESKR